MRPPVLACIFLRSSVSFLVQRLACYYKKDVRPVVGCDLVRGADENGLYEEVAAGVVMSSATGVAAVLSAGVADTAEAGWSCAAGK
ncbi:hypothetical protein ON010_g11783 [Phytophthora cinnamomi]|nr:hypothetical protein ON010_g11783 [Phytophthora cinnamomi]